MSTKQIDSLVVDAMLNQQTDNVFFKDRESRFVRVSRGLVQHFGVQSAEELLGKTDFDFFADEHAREAYEDEQHVIATGQPMPPKIEREVWPNRADNWVSTTKLPWRDESGEIVGIFGISRDITREHLLKLELERKTELLENSNRELEQFAFIASHDLQEPIRMIAGFVQLIERRYNDVLDERGREYIRFVVEGSSRMQALINGLLQYSRVKTKTSDLEPIDCSLVLADVVRNLQVLIKETDAQMDIENDLPVVLGVRSQISQVFQNLLNNAIKFRRKDVPPLITVSVKHEGDHSIVCVADNGIGIAPKYQNRIFGMFQRLHTREQYAGNGIGLAMTKRIMIHHGGNISLESEVDEGARFYLKFPRTEANDESYT
ncbi:sensor histidine kinase [Cerasicoccus maritimus]|uniref:sensor histidine kinase n=1 Tax=Cerasicoccus maritimus TaxID=490089 RepID=UPI0028528619|nr:ATP-binding protein [Cerasicoccus maritimus]